MTPEELIRAAIGAINGFDREAVERLCTDDFQMFSPMSEIRGHPYEGHGGAHQWLDDMEENFESVDAGIDEIREIRSDRYLVLGDVKVEGRTSGLDYVQRVGWVVELRDGGIRCIWLIVDPEEAEKKAATL